DPESGETKGDENQPDEQSGNEQQADAGRCRNLEEWQFHALSYAGMSPADSSRAWMVLFSDSDTGSSGARGGPPRSPTWSIAALTPAGPIAPPMSVASGDSRNCNDAARTSSPLRAASNASRTIGPAN